MCYTYACVLSILRKMSPAVFSRSTTSESMASAFPHPKLQPPPPRPSKRAPDVAAPVVAKESAQKKSKPPSVCTAAKSVAVKHEVQEDFAKQPILRLKHLSSMSLRSPPQPKAAAPTPAAPAEQPPPVPKQAPVTAPGAPTPPVSAPQRLEAEPKASMASNTAPRDATATLHKEGPEESEVTCTAPTGSVPTPSQQAPGESHALGLANMSSILKHEPGTLQARASALRRPSCKHEHAPTPAHLSFVEPATAPQADQPPMSEETPQPKAATPAQPKAATPPMPVKSPQPKAAPPTPAAASAVTVVENPSVPTTCYLQLRVSIQLCRRCVFLHAWQVPPIVPANYNERQALQAEFKRPFVHAMDKGMYNTYISFNPFQSVFEVMFYSHSPLTGGYVIHQPTKSRTTLSHCGKMR